MGPNKYEIEVFKKSFTTNYVVAIRCAPGLSLAMQEGWRGMEDCIRARRMMATVAGAVKVF